MIEVYKIAKEFFEEFVKSYDLDEGNIINTYYYKYRHTYDVVNMMEKITTNLSEQKKDILKTIVIFHDLGRFVQLEKYKAYDDVKSHFDHALESVKVLEENKFFENNNIDEELKKKMCEAIYFHNKLSIDDCSNEALEYARYIRDADKLGVLYRTGKYDNLDEISSVVLEAFKKEKLIDYGILKTQSDGLLSELAFIFDFNFDISKAILVNEGILDKRVNVFKDLKGYDDIVSITLRYKEKVECMV